ncbi:MAG TPA: SxtJ family membrane protein [Pyrinomonadaceae bacterium]
MIEPGGSVTRHDAAGAVTDAQARKSALLVAAVLLCIAAWNLYRGRTGVALAFGAPGGLLVVAGLLVPPAARAFHTAWMRFAVLLGHVNSRILLTLVYYLVVTPYGVVTRLAGRDPLRRRGRAEGGSHWVERKATRQAREGFERLF